MAKTSMASRLLHSELRMRGHIYSRIKHVMEGVDMAFYDRSSGIGFVYSNLGEILKRVQSKTVSGHPLMSESLHMQAPAVQKDGLVELRANVERLQDMHGRLQFMMGEIQDVVKRKSS